MKSLDLRLLIYVQQIRDMPIIQMMGNTLVLGGFALLIEMIILLMKFCLMVVCLVEVVSIK